MNSGKTYNPRKQNRKECESKLIFHRKQKKQNISFAATLQDFPFPTINIYSKSFNSRQIMIKSHHSYEQRCIRVQKSLSFYSLRPQIVTKLISKRKRNGREGFVAIFKNILVWNLKFHSNYKTPLSDHWIKK